ncbi:alpha/beta hydrolase [Nocardioides sp. GY 10127]|uniref:alpha/beta hydrolase n=1 Tax=Nocardioides sp. GY 10127 TaxID=2569762 RepID=UPI0010A7619E|nr:alpha/beta hydrolase [Nocardioides sp. GY 10127]TIC84008.1 alpha/beta hydrolase [Nocardioides sp. GY 10127]
MTLHPAFRTYLDELEPLVAAAAAAGVEPTPESARAALAGLNAFSAAPTPVAVVRDSEVPGVPGEQGRPGVGVRVYVPRPGVPSDVVLFVHGGGHMAGDLDVYDSSARRTAAATGMVVVSVDYRRSPEAPYPLGLLDVEHVLDHLDEVLLDDATTGTVHAMADSGGGAKLASVAMRAAAGERTSPIARQVLLYPSLDYTMSGDTVAELGTGYFLTAERVAWYFDHYFPSGADRVAASPVTGPFSADMPDTLVVAAEYDPLRSEAETYVRRVREAGGSAHLLVAPGMIHAFAFFETLVPDEVGRLYEVVGGFLADGAVPASW